MKVHHAAEGIAAVHCGTRTEDDLGALYDVGVNGYDVLNVALTVDGIVQAYAVNIDENPVRGKSPEHRASAAELTLLYKDITAERDEISGCLGIHYPYNGLCHNAYVIGHLFGFLFPPVCRDDELLNLEGLCLQFHNHAGCLKLLRGE